MQRRSHRAHSRAAGPLATLVALLAIAAAWSAGAVAAKPAHSATSAVSVTQARQAARVARYWTPARMRGARPLDLVVGASGKARLRVGAPAVEPAAGASFLTVSTPDVPPYSVNGRIFIRRGSLAGYCSGTAINSPTRRLVLTAGHCINSGREGGKKSVWSNYLEFVPAYNGGVAPFGAFVGRRGAIRAPRQWTNHGNPDFDMGAFLTLPNSEGVNVADAVGGGATIVTDLTRHQTFETFGYPGETKYMQKCVSPYIGDDLLSNPFPGPPTLGIRCHWAPGASGGGWLIGDGTQINGVNTYLHLNNKSRTFGPYFSAETVGKLVEGF
jgi:V8-like Glu-specific endopeptidase